MRKTTNYYDVKWLYYFEITGDVIIETMMFRLNYLLSVDYYFCANLMKPCENYLCIIFRELYKRCIFSRNRYIAIYDFLNLNYDFQTE